MTRVAVISANLGAYDPPNDWPVLDAPAGVEVSVHRFTDATLPPRPLAMTSRLQCGIPKWFGWELVPGHEVYIWIDASCAPTAGCIGWWLDRLGTADVVVFQHPDRRTVSEEYTFIRQRMARPGERYLTSRYAGEWLDEQYAAIAKVDGLAHEPLLYASTAFAYRPRPHVREAFAKIFLQKARYLLHDQLAFGPTLERHECRVQVIRENYLKCLALVYTRNQRRRAS